MLRTPHFARSLSFVALGIVLSGCTGWIGDLAESEETQAGALSGPGAAPLRRLSNAEYNLTMKTLLGITGASADGFPPDRASFGFDTVGDGLEVTPTHVRGYFDSAERLAGEPDVRAYVLSGCADASCIDSTLGAFAKRAWRRPISTAELTELRGVFNYALESGGTFEDGASLAIQTVLSAPEFLYLVQASDDDAVEIRALTDFELATRLSYFLWSTTPDDELLEAAEKGELGTDEGLRFHATRLLDDGRSDAFVMNFGDQWLELRSLAMPDLGTFPSWDAELGASMIEETRSFLDANLRSERPIEDLLLGTTTFVNDRLRTHYGLPGSGEGFIEVSLDGTTRMGLLTQGAIATVTSRPSRTSPVQRGNFVLNHLLCDPVPPPKGVAAQFPDDLEAGTQRERLTQHQSDPLCASCHSIMDPIGFGLDKFDGIGAYRESEAGQPIDDSGTMPNGQTFVGAKELAHLIAEDERFPRCVAKQLATYGVGRSFNRHADDALLEDITIAAQDNGGSLREFVLAVILSPAFRERTTSAPAPAEHLGDDQ